MTQTPEQQAQVERLESNSATNNYHDAYRGAREDLLDWKRRAQVAEATIAQLQAEVGRLSALAGPSGKDLGALERINDELLADNDQLQAQVKELESRLAAGEPIDTVISGEELAALHEWSKPEGEAGIRLFVTDNELHMCSAEYPDEGSVFLADLAAPQPPEVDQWLPIESAPDVSKGGVRWCSVAVKRKNSDKVYVMPACYTNEYPLTYDYFEAVERSGNGWSEALADPEDDEADALATGWFSPRASNGDYDSVWEPLLTEGDELVGWMPLPSPPNPEGV